MIESEIISVRTAARILSISDRAVRGLAGRQSIPARKVDAGEDVKFKPWIFDKKDIEKERDDRDRYRRSGRGRWWTGG